MRRHGFVTLFALVLATAGHAAMAQNAYPTRAIRLIVPYGAGGASDVMARKFGKELNDRFGQPVVIENMPVAAGVVAYTTVSRAAPDGYTLVYGTSSLAVNAVLKSNPPYDPLAGFEPISMLLAVQNLLVVPNALPVTTVGELVQLAKSKPGELNFVSLGRGSTPHLSAELFRAAAGINIQQVPYRQTTQAYVDLIENRVQLWIASMPSALPHVQADKLRALAVAGHHRSPSLPNVPTLIESGIPAETTFWQGIFAPPSTPGPIIEKLNQFIRNSVANPDIKGWYLNLGAELEASSPGELRNAVKSDMVKWSKIADEIGLERN